MSAVLHPNYYSKASQLSRITTCSKCGRRVLKSETYTGRVCKKCHTSAQRKEKTSMSEIETLKAEVNELKALLTTLKTESRKEALQRDEATTGSSQAKHISSKQYDKAFRKWMRDNKESLKLQLKEVNAELAENTLENMVSRLSRRGTVSRVVKK